MYPTLKRVPHTAFSCEGRDWGLHADTEAYCQVKVPVVFALGRGHLSRAGTRGMLPSELLCIYVRVGGLIFVIASSRAITSRVLVVYKSGTGALRVTLASRIRATELLRHLSLGQDT
jgi:hypothetical protein